MDERILNLVNKANSSSVVIKHKNNIDVVFHATSGDHTGASDANSLVVKFVGFWVNVASASPFIIDTDVIYIKPQDIENWLEVADPRGA